jgi:hypothetical protein
VVWWPVGRSREPLPTSESAKRQRRSPNGLPQPECWRSGSRDCKTGCTHNGRLLTTRKGAKTTMGFLADLTYFSKLDRWSHHCNTSITSKLERTAPQPSISSWLVNLSRWRRPMSGPLVMNNQTTMEGQLDRRTNNFDLLRLLAAWFVLFSHCYPLTGQPVLDPFARYTGIDTLGGIGVSIFFVLSGYLVTNSLERSSSVFSFARKACVPDIPRACGVDGLLCLLAWTRPHDATTRDLSQAPANSGLPLERIRMENSICPTRSVRDESVARRRQWLTLVFALRD